ncbi:MAG: ATP-binding protein, partial [bacterium]
MFHSEHLQEKWAPLLNCEGLDSIKDSHKRAVTAVLLENQERFLKEQNAFASSGSFLTEAPITNSGNAAGAGGAFGGGSPVGGPTAGFDPVLISLIRRSMPNLVAYDLAGVQPMTGPTGLIFAMRSRYEGQAGQEALFDEADTSFSGQRGADGTYATAGIGVSAGIDANTNPGLLNDGGTYNVSAGMVTGDSEQLGGDSGAFNQMAFSIEKVTVTARSRALKAEYSLELAQDLKAIHGLNAEAELANILSSEILAEINR